MASATKGQYTRTKEWAKHLRKIGKKMFWGTERTLSKKAIKKGTEI
jgi:hypothetical protein